MGCSRSSHRCSPLSRLLAADPPSGSARRDRLLVLGCQPNTAPALGRPAGRRCSAGRTDPLRSAPVAGHRCWFARRRAGHRSASGSRGDTVVASLREAACTGCVQVVTLRRGARASGIRSPRLITVSSSVPRVGANDQASHLRIATRISGLTRPPQHRHERSVLADLTDTGPVPRRAIPGAGRSQRFLRISEVSQPVRRSIITSNRTGWRKR